jgi:hypothetical protein
MDDHVEAQLAGDVDGLVVGHVVDQDDPAHDVVRDVGIGAFERQRRVVGGHDDDDPRRAVGGRGRRSDRGVRDGHARRVPRSLAWPGHSPSRACATMPAQPKRPEDPAAMFEPVRGKTITPHLAEPASSTD